jgi:hypothetical protein
MTQFYRTYVPIEGSLSRRLYGISGNAGRWCGHVAPSAFKVLNQVSVSSSSKVMETGFSKL